MNEILASSTKPPPRSPIIMVAVDSALDPSRNALLETAASVLANMPARVSHA